jgi:hypothetical protein
MLKTIIILICVSTNVHAFVKQITLTEAIKKHLINVTFGNRGYLIGKCIEGNYFNISDDTLNIETENGMYLKALSGTGIDAIITKRVNTIIPKKMNVRVSLWALATKYCTGNFDMNSMYEIAKNPIPESVKLCEMIDSLDLNCYTGQTAMVAFMNKANNTEIRGAYIAKVNALRKYTAKTFNQQYIYFGTDVEFMKNPVYRPMLIGTSIALGDKGNYFIKNFNEGDNIEMALYNNMGQKVNNLGFQYYLFGSHGFMLHDLAASNFPNKQKYFVRIIHNGILETEWIVDVTG